jgi:ankyrin repeat protein
LTLKKIFQDQKAIALAEAAEKADFSQIDALLSDGVLIDSHGEYGFTPLAWALFQGNQEGFEYLLKKGASPNAFLKEGKESILLWAAKMEDPFFLDTALKYGGDPNQKLPMFNWEEPLFWFTLTNKRLENLKTLIRHGVDVDATRHNGKTIISCAAGLNQYDAVCYLLEQGAKYPLERRYGTLLERIERQPVNPKDSQYVWRNKVVERLRSQGVEVMPCEWSKEAAPKIIDVQTK